MKALPKSCLRLASLALAALGFAAPLVAEDAGAIQWQNVVSSQIRAFRDHDAPAAFSHAGIAFQATFPDAEAFFVTIIQSGYAPIMESRSHSFGPFRRMNDDSVVQRVQFIGKDQSIYDALYQLDQESGAWRVQGVELMPPKGVAI